MQNTIQHKNIYVLAIWCRAAPMGANLAAYANEYTSIHMYIHASVHAIMLENMHMVASAPA
jgi:hypothetical protein